MNIAHGCYIDAVQSNQIDEWKKEEEEERMEFSSISSIVIQAKFRDNKYYHASWR